MSSSQQKFSIYYPHELENFDRLSASFDCGNLMLNYYLTSNALTDTEHTTWIFVNSDKTQIIAYISFQCSGLTTRTHNQKQWHITSPAIQINFFALDSQYHHRKYPIAVESINYSSFIFKYALNLLIDIAHYTIAAKYITVYAVPGSENFYRRNYFRTYAEFTTASVDKIKTAIADNWDFIDHCLPMYLAIN
ncbi:hypothetical protein IJJ08_00910 [bacterium]|nr:hypothetical protein [bacterium]